MVTSSGTPRFFVTLDGLNGSHSAESLESAYASAAVLSAAGLEFVVASVPSRDGGYTVPLADGLLSCTPWLEGTVAGSGPISSARLARANAAALARLHTATPPTRMPTWQPLVDAQFAATLATSLRNGWECGPYGERAHAAIAEHIGAIQRWTAAYHQLAKRSLSHSWVPTHGEPHTRNQLITDSGLVFVDWESLTLAPRERDLRTLVDSGYVQLITPDWAMIEMFELEWRLDELSQYSTWFSHPHDGTADDREAFAGLIEELERPDWKQPN